MNKRITIIAVIFIILAIVLGAFGAHALKAVLTTEQLTSYETGVKYQMYSALGLLILGLNEEKLKFSLKATSALLIVGTIFFSFSIYILSLQDTLGVSLRFLGPITPIGGSLLIIGWSIFLYKLISVRN